MAIYTTSLYKLLRYGNILCLTFNNKKHRLYMMKKGNVYVVEDDQRLHENERQFIDDFDDKSLQQIEMRIYYPDRTYESFVIWDKSDAGFDWNVIFQSMKNIRKQVGFSKIDIFKHSVDIVPLKILCAKMYRDHFGLEASHDVKNIMDFETQNSVFKKQVWWV